MDIRVGRVLKAERIPGTEKLIRLEVDIGEERPRQLVAGVADYYTPEELLGKNIVVLANLEAKKIRGVVSNGMLLAADVNGRPYILTVDDEVPPGSPVR
ncbi:methionine--tRNA ligase [Candidatus Bathyarchaeota archaeon]|nr:MAG: methionine--tRNA ligase [Candidatus Bathyarchaeota archaeon]